MEDPEITKGLASVGTIVQTASAAKGFFSAGKAALQGGEARRSAGYYRAAGLDIRAGQTRASSQRVAASDRLKGELLGSKTLAAAAASGGGAADPTVLKVLADIAGRSEFNALSALYSGETAARGLEQQGRLARYEGNVAAFSGRVQRGVLRQKGISTIAKGADTLYRRYGEPEKEAEDDYAYPDWNPADYRPPYRPPPKADPYNDWWEDF